MASLPNTNFRMWDFNLAENFNQAAIAKLLISVFPINGTRFFFGNMYAILDKLRDDGVKLQFHRAYNGLIGLTGYTINEGSEEALIYTMVSIGDFDSTTTRISTRHHLHQLSQLLLQISQRALQLQIHTLLRALPQLHLLIQAPPPPPPGPHKVD